MSTIGSNTYSIFSELENENSNVHLGKQKRDDVSNKLKNKRPALGTITNVPRIQPSRAVKNAPSYSDRYDFSLKENVAPAPFKEAGLVSLQTKNFSSNQHFNIHCDEVSLSGIDSVIPKPNLAQSLTVLQPISNELCRPESTIEESPMLLDESFEFAELKQDESEAKEFRLQKILTVPEYADEIYAYLRSAELKNRPKVGYMKKQTDITPSMRAILVDWLVEVAEEYKLHRETLVLTVNYIDRFLSQMSVLRGKIQLVGTACMFLASKYEEIYPPEVGEFVYITDDTYTKKQVLRMEHLILKVLSFDVAIPTYNCFCEKFLKDSNADATVQSLTMYLAEMTMLDSESFLKYLPSVIAASSLCLANLTVGKEPWSLSDVRQTGYSIADLQPCLSDLHVMYQNAPSHPQQAIRQKYQQPKFHQVASIPAPSSLSFL